MESSLSSSIVFSLSAWRNPEEGQAAPHKGKIALVELGFVGALLIAPIEMLVFAILIPMTALLYPISRAPMDWAIRGIVSSGVAFRFGLSGLVNNIAKDRLPASEAEALGVSECGGIKKMSTRDQQPGGEFSWDRLASGNEFGFKGLTEEEKTELALYDLDIMTWFGTCVVYRLAFGDMANIEVPAGQLPADLIERIRHLRNRQFSVPQTNPNAEWNTIENLEAFNGYKTGADATEDVPLTARINASHQAFQESIINADSREAWGPFIHLGQDA